MKTIEECGWKNFWTASGAFKKQTQVQKPEFFETETRKQC